MIRGQRSKVVIYRSIHVCQPAPILVINNGSSSLKSSVLDPKTETVLSSGLAERIGTEQGLLKLSDLEKVKHEEKLPLADHRSAGPYFYLPKLESHLEARLWNDVFNFTQDSLGVARGSIRATVLIETIMAAFEMDEILYELKDYSAGLNCGRWDYIFSCIKRGRYRVFR